MNIKYRNLFIFIEEVKYFCVDEPKNLVLFRFFIQTNSTKENRKSLSEAISDAMREIDEYIYQFGEVPFLEPVQWLD